MGSIKTWGIGLLNATVSGLASGIAGGLAGTTAKQTAIIVAASALVSVAKWVLQHPIPGGE